MHRPPCRLADREKAFTDGRFVWFNAAKDPVVPLRPNGSAAEQEQYRSSLEERARAWFEAACDALAHHWGAQHVDTTEQISCDMQRYFQQKYEAFIATVLAGA
jgi:hypothetical protein